MDLVKDEMTEVLMQQRALHKQVMKQLADEMEEYISWLDESHKKVANNPFDMSYMKEKPANGYSIFKRIANYREYLEGCKDIFYKRGGKSKSDYIKMMEKMGEFEKIGRVREKDIMAMEDKKTRYANYQYHRIAKAQNNLINNATTMDPQERKEDFELINHEIDQMEKVIIAERHRLLKKPSQYSKGAKKIALRIEIMQDYVYQLKQNQTVVKNNIQQFEVNKTKQYNALANSLASRHRFVHTADGKYVLFIPTDEELSSPDGKYLQRELKKYENTYQQYKKPVTVEKNLPYQAEKIKVVKGTVTVIDETVEKKNRKKVEEEELTVDEYLKRREERGFPNYLFRVVSEEGLSKVFDLHDNVVKIYRIPGNYDPNMPEEMNTAIKDIAMQTKPAPGIPDVLNTNANKNIINGGSANPMLMTASTVTIDKKCGDKDFTELIRDHAEDVENDTMDRETSNQQINQIVLQQLKLKKQWKDSNNSVLHMDDKMSDWRVTAPSKKDGHSTGWRVYQVDRDSLSSYDKLNNKINSRNIEAQNGMTLSYIHNKLNAKRLDHDRNYSTTVDKYRNYRHGVDMPSIAINKSLDEQHFQRELENLDDLLGEIEYLQVKGDMDKEITDSDIKELDKCMNRVGHLLSTSDKQFIKDELKEHGYIKDKELRARLVYLKRMLFLDRGPKLIEKIAQIKSRDDFNGKLTTSQRDELWQLMRGNYIRQEYREMILKGDFDNPLLKAELEPLRALLRRDNAKDRYVRVQLDNRVALLEQGLVNDAFMGLEADQFAMNLSTTLIRDFDDDLVNDLSLEDLILLYENREAVNEYLLNHSPAGKQTPEKRAQLVRIALDLLKNEEFEHEFNSSLLKNYMKANAAQLNMDNIDILGRYRDVIVDSLASKNLINIPDVEQRNQIINDTIDNARYLIKCLENGQPDNTLKNRVESKTGLKRKGFASKQQRNLEYLAQHDSQLVKGVLKRSSEQFNAKLPGNLQIDKKYKREFNQRWNNLSQKVRKKALPKRNQMRNQENYKPRSISVQVPNTSHIQRKTKKPYAKREQNADNVKRMNKKSHDYSSQYDANRFIKPNGQNYNKTKSKGHSYSIRHFQAEKTAQQNIKNSSKDIKFSKTMK